MPLPAPPSPARPGPRARPGPLLLVALICLAAAACGGSGGDGDAAPTTAAPAATGTTTAPTQACADAAALKAAVDDLDKLDVEAVGKAGLQDALQNVRTRLQTLRASAAGTWGAQAGELDAAIDGFQTTVAGFDADNLLAELPTIVSNLERVDNAWTTLERDIDRTCG